MTAERVMAVDHKKNFDVAVKNLVDLRKKIEKADTLSEVSQLEKEVRNALMAVIHYSNFLSYWMREAADKRRKEIREEE